MRRIWTVARRELRALFDLPTGYILLVVFLAINGFLFFRQAFLSQTASLRPMLDLLPWEFLFFVPAVTMRALAEDIRSGQIEVVLAQPLSELELLLGKYLGSVLFLWIALALTLAIPLGLAVGADLPWGTIVAQYVGAALLAAGLAGIGVWASSLSRSQITAFILAAGVMFLLVLLGLDPLIVGLPPLLGAAAARIGVLSHFESMGRGVIDLRDVIYFLSLAGIFLALAYGALLGRKLAPATGTRSRLRLGVAMLATSLVVVNLLGSYIGGRLDLTPGQAYTLSPATREIAAEPGRSGDRQGLRVQGAAHRGRADEARSRRPAPRSPQRGQRADPRGGARPRRRSRGQAGCAEPRHPAGAVQRDRAVGAAGEGGISRARDPARQPDRDDSAGAAHR